MNVVSSSHFNRGRDFKIVNQFVMHASPYYILNIHSIRAVGRTTFLKDIKKQHYLNRPVALIGVQDYKLADEVSGYPLNVFLRQIVKQLSSFEAPDKVIQAEDKENQWQVSDLAFRILELIDNFLEEKFVPLILIDDYDHLPYGARSVLEDAIVSQLFEQPRKTALVLASEQPLLFTNRLDLRVRLKHHELKPLTENDIAHIVPQKYSVLAPEIFKRTAGIPDLVGFLVDKTSSLSIGSLKEYQEREKEILDHEYHKQVNNIVFPDVREKSSEALDILAMLRRFDVKVLSSLLPKINQETFGTYKQKDYLNLIRELGSQAYWREKGGYALDNMLSAMISSYIFTVQPETFKKYNQSIMSMYSEWLREKYRPHYLLEMLYHQMLLEKSKGLESKALQNNLSNKLLEFLEGKWGTKLTDVDELDLLRHSLDKDKDLRHHINQKVFDKIDHLLMHKLSI